MTRGRNRFDGWRRAFMRAQARAFALGCALSATPALLIARPAMAETPHGWLSPQTLSPAALVLALIGLAALAWRVSRPSAPSASRKDGLSWRRLEDEKVIDGYLLWDAEDRLEEYSATWLRYLPQLANWNRPTARQMIAALVESGHMVVPDGLQPAEAVEHIDHLRQQVPGLRELRMADGTVLMGRTLDLGGGRNAGLFTDVTALRRNQEARRASEALFRTAFDASPSMMLLLDHAQRPLAMNRAFAATLGYDMDRLAKLGWAGIIHPADSTDKPGTPPWVPATKRLIAADGSVLRCEVRVTPVRDSDDEQTGRRLITAIDLTARWETEERARFQASLLDHVSNAVLAVDHQGRILYGNRAAQTLFQWSEPLLMGVPMDRLLGAEVMDAVTTDGIELETTGRTWNGSHFPASVTIARTTDGTGNPTGAVLVISDLTQRRALDLQLMHSARLATLGEMAASIAHEFNQCLHVIRLASEALRLDVTDGRMEIERFTRRADNILTQVDRLTEMVMQMRTISRRDAEGKRPFKPQLALDAALRMVEPLLQADGVKLVRQGGLGQATVLGRQVRLEQVLLNLLNNARDAIHERVRDDGGLGTVTVRCNVDAGQLIIAVRDDGTGVPESVGHHIFEPFVTTKDDSRGCGLGLSISRGICTEMGGTLTFENVERGAEFVVTLPVQDSEAALPSPAEPMPAAPPANLPAANAAHYPEDDVEHDAQPDDDDLPAHRRLLLVDDEALSVMMVSEFLERQGYVVDTAYDGVEALEHCNRHVYDAVITDIRMPRMDGRVLIERLADLQPGTPVIVVTGHLKESHAAELGPNVHAILTKPFQLLRLREQLNHLEDAHSRVPHHIAED